MSVNSKNPMDSVSGFFDTTKERWEGLEPTDQYVIIGAAVLTVGGAIVSIFNKSGVAFLGGAALGAGLVIARAVTKPKEEDPSPRRVAGASGPVRNDRMPRQSPRRQIDYTYGGGELGAPIGEMVDSGPVKTFNGLVTKDEAADFPMWHRHVEVDVRTEPLDDRIRWATNAPLGPYNGSTVTGFW